MRRSWARRGGAVAYGVVLLVGYTMAADRYAGSVPEWVLTGVFLVLLVGGGYALKHGDRRRWGRMARSLGFESLDDAEAGFSSWAYRGRLRARPVTVDFWDGPRSLVADETRFVAPHHGDLAPTLVVQRTGAGGTGGSDLPPDVELSAPAFEADFQAFSPDPAFAGSVLSRRVRDAIADATDLVELAVEEGTVRATYAGLLLDADVANRYAKAVCTVAEAVEAERSAA